MNNFFKFIFASCLGVFLSVVVMALFGGFILAKMVGQAERPVAVSPNTVLQINLDEPIPERTNNKALDKFNLETEDIIGLQDIVRTIQYAKTDDNIKGIFLNLSNASFGQATSSVLRRALEDFKADGKFIVSWSEYYSQNSYYLASLADKIYVMPTGGMDFRGFATQIPFMRDMLERLGVNMQVYYAGQFKSATEQFRLYEMSEQNRLQIREYLEGLYGKFIDDIAESRNLESAEVRRIAEQFMIRTTDDAVKYKLIDDTAYFDEALTDIRNRIGLEEKDKLRSILLSDYHKGAKPVYPSGKKRIAVVYAEGEIIDGKGEPGNVGGEKYAKIIRKIRQDKKVAALVLRVNSPGGSGMASDMIWREVELTKEEGIPVIVSMGDVAASGGYYIACNADSIFVEPNTITGSIGVFGLIPSVQDMLKDKVGIVFDTVKTGPYAAAFTPFFDINPAEGKVIQGMVDNFYETFLTRVADGRGMTRKEAHAVAQGRVWTGAKAREIGLVDAFGGLDDAIAAAAQKADLEEYRIKEYPITKNPLQQYIDKFTGMEQHATTQVLQSELGDLYPFYQYLSSLKNCKGVQARLPFSIDVK